MKNFARSLKRQDGFTLVELMVVVAIIGLLSAVAIPNFKKYQAKAKMSEAKLQLSALYTAQASFYSDYNIYHNCLTYMGFDPGPEALNRYYAVGIDVNANINTTAYQAAVNSGLNTVDCGITNASTQGATGSNSANNSTYFLAGKGVGATVANATSFMGSGSVATIGTQAGSASMNYTAVAGGVISQDFITPGAVGTGNNSLMTINQNKIISVIRNGF